MTYYDSVPMETIYCNTRVRPKRYQHTCWLSALMKPEYHGKETAGELFCHLKAPQPHLLLPIHGCNLHSTKEGRERGKDEG